MKFFDKFKKKKADNSQQPAASSSLSGEASGLRAEGNSQQGQIDKKKAELKQEVEAVEKDKTEKVEKKPIKKPSEGSGDAYRILIKPVLTEKSNFLGEQSQYVFEVSPRANKIMVKKAIKNVYDVDPAKVNIVTVKGKQVRTGRRSGKRKDWKKAVVILKKGQKIEVFEGV